MPRTPYRTAVSLSLGLVSALSLSACGSGSPAADVSAGCKNEQVKIASASPSFVYLPYYVAQASGYFKDEGLDVEAVDLSTGASIVAGTVSSTVDIAMTTLAEVATAKSEGAPITAFAQVTDFATNVVIKKSVAKSKGLTAESTDADKIATLKGLRVGVTGAGSGSDLLVRYLAKVGGMDPDKDLTITATGSSANSVAGFASDRFDAIAISSPQSDVGIQQGQGDYLFKVASGDYTPLAKNVYIVAVTSDRNVKSRPNVMRCFTKALAHAQDEIHSDPEKAAAAAKKFVGEDIDADMYNASFKANLPSWPGSPVIDESGAKGAIEFQNTVSGSHLDDAVLAKAVNTDIAKSAVAQP